MVRRLANGPAKHLDVIIYRIFGLRSVAEWIRFNCSIPPCAPELSSCVRPAQLFALLPNEAGQTFLLFQQTTS